MDKKQALALNESTKGFYSKNAGSFSNTRHSAWDGWARSLELISEITGDRSDGRLDILDIACGNMRFERFVDGLDEFKGSELYATCIDIQEFPLPSSDGPVRSFEHTTVNMVYADIIEALASDRPLIELIPNRSFDIVVCFAFMHHIPEPKWRLDLLLSAVEVLKPEGFLIVSFWQPLEDHSIRRKAVAASMSADSKGLIELSAEEGDFYLGWQGEHDALRYCHHTSDIEIGSLLQCLLEKHPEVEVCSEFSADGSSEKMNRYVILRKNG